MRVVIALLLCMAVCTFGQQVHLGAHEGPQHAAAFEQVNEMDSVDHSEYI